MTVHHPLARRRRARGALVLVAALVGVLGFAFFRVQVLSSSTYRLRAESNRLRPLDVPAARGAVYDRNGVVIADNVPAFSVSIVPGPTDSLRATLDRLLPYLDLTPERVERLREQVSVARLAPLLLEPDASFEAASALEERRSDFPNVLIEMRPKRRYVAGPAIAHLMGTIGEIDAEELTSERFPDDRYEQGMIVGKTGIERQYEHRLQGTRGLRYVEVDAAGRIVGDFGGIEAQPSDPGEDLVLNIDLGLQRWIHEIFPKDKSGAVIALDGADGGVLAMYSYPTFDPNDFVGGIDRPTWEALVSDTLRPIYNRGILGVFPPASTFKPIVAAMALDLGVVDPETTMTEPCTGGYYYGGQYRRCWDASGHGFVGMTGAIRDSCNVYFYQLGLQIGLDRFLGKGVELGLTRRCGIDLPEESRGTFPESREFWLRIFGDVGREGEVLSLAIGQGPNSQTPLKMAQLYLAFARDGSAPAPALARERPDTAEGWDLDLSEEHLRTIRDGLRAVTAPGGTAYRSSLEQWDLLGKTGSGENARSQAGTGETDAWFAGIVGPRGGDPEIVIIVMVEQGGGGSATAAPIAAKAADYYLRAKHGLPFDSLQTLGEHADAGIWEAWMTAR